MLYAISGALFLILWAIIAPTLPLLRRAGALAAHLIARASLRWAPVSHLTTRFRDYVPVAAVVIGGMIVTAWAGDSFLDLAEMIRDRNPAVQDVDTLAHAWAISRRSPSSTSFFDLMTIIGSPPVLAALGACVGVLLLLTGRDRWFVYLAVTAGGGALLDWELKRFFARARPDVAEMLRQAHGYSFPSGHAMGSTVMLGALSYLAFRTLSHWRWKSAVLAFAWTLIAAISTSRVYLGVHWLTDVVAGIAAGAMWVGVTTVAYETLRRVRMLRATST